VGDATTGDGAMVVVTAAVGAAVGAGGGAPVNVMRPSTWDATGAFKYLM
jgi:hypothetical protein